MGKGAQTRSEIIAKTAALFNQKGFAGTSIADILDSTGLGKGGLYNHFSTKDQLALESFDYCLSRIRERVDAALEGKEHAADRLVAISSVFADSALDPVIPGGSPLLNTAVEADDTHPGLRDRSRDAFERWHQLIRGTVRKGIARGELQDSIDPDSFASLFIASLEGGVVLTRLHNDSTHIQRVRAFLESYVKSMSDR